MKYSVILFKNKHCDLCKLMQQELIDNPPNCDVKIINVDREGCNYETDLYAVEYFPTTLLIDDKGIVINRFEGFIDSKSIDINIKEYETKYMV